jgi:aminoglycoside phosphotransferase (APT) family kinase protein
MTEAPARPKAIPPDEEDIRARAEASIQERFPASRLTSLVRFTGGSSSLTYSAGITGAALSQVVVKAAPAGLPAVRNRDVWRQARILEALAKVDGVAIPEVYGKDPGAGLETPPLIVMQYVDGQSYEPRHTDPAEGPSDAEVLTRGKKAAAMLAVMHRAPVGELGLADEPVVTLADEIERWRKAAGSCELKPEEAELEEWVYSRLVESIPAQLDPAILHGDWRLGNMQCTADRIDAVIDWEIWAIGDPRVDLAWAQLMSDRAHPSAHFPDAVSLEPQEWADEYSAARGSDIGSMDWFGALIRYKQAAVTMLLVKNAARRGDTDERWAQMDAGTVINLRGARDRLA